ncbi:hypothetical protein Hanom_Chr14g01309951 [Helianthus anomalus]
MGRLLKKGIVGSGLGWDKRVGEERIRLLRSVIRVLVSECFLTSLWRKEAIDER